MHDKTRKFLELIMGRRQGVVDLNAGEKTPASLMACAEFQELCFVRKSTFVAGDPTATARNEGRREAFLYFQNWIGMTDNELTKMAQDEKDRQLAGFIEE